MITISPVSKLSKYKKIDENFIIGVDCNLKQYYLYSFYSLLPYSFFNYFPYTMYTTNINSIFAITDKRILVLEKDSSGNIDERRIYSYYFNEVGIRYKKNLGKRFFIIDKMRKDFFSLEYNTSTIEIDCSNIKQAENIYNFLEENKLLKKPEDYI